MDWQKAKCVIGATLGTPLVFAAIILVSAGFGWVLKNAGIFSVICGGIIGVFLIVIVWYGLYEKCREACERKRKWNI